MLLLSSSKMQTALVETLAHLHPAKAIAPQVVTTPNGCYVLYGDLFNTGRNYAMAELPSKIGGIGFAVRSDTNWVPLGLWCLSPIWRPKGSKKYAGEHMPIEPAEHPFWLQKLSNDGPPEMIVVGDVWKYWQEHYIMHFDAGSQRLMMVGECMSAEFQDGWVILPYDSGHRSVYWGRKFMQWSGGNLIQKARWQEGVNEHDTDEFIDGCIEEVSRLTSTGETEEFVIKHYSGSEDADHSPKIVVFKGQSVYATLDIRWTGKLDERYRHGFESRYLFEKLTGLPSKLCSTELRTKTSRLEDLATITVEGSPDAQKRLGVNKKP